MAWDSPDDPPDIPLCERHGCDMSPDYREEEDDQGRIVRWVKLFCNECYNEEATRD